uniref:Uncharacterized protein n=1 Tax=Sphaerodactylus townsendi TaxID=933632 RepID=A0ACB8EAX4_9SAUR
MTSKACGKGCHVFSASSLPHPLDQTTFPSAPTFCGKPFRFAGYCSQLCISNPIAELHLSSAVFLAATRQEEMLLDAAPDFSPFLWPVSPVPPLPRMLPFRSTSSPINTWGFPPPLQFGP